MTDNTKKDSDSTPIKGGTDLGEPGVFTRPRGRQLG